jgi:hypothetical protein
MFDRRSLTTALLVAGDGGVLVACSPRVDGLAGALAHPHAWVARVGVDAALVSAATTVFWLAAAWLALGLAACALAHLPGAAGRLGDRLASRVLPGVVHTVLVGTVGAGVLLTPVTAGVVGATAGVVVVDHGSAGSAGRPAIAAAGPLVRVADGSPRQSALARVLTADSPTPSPVWPTSGPPSPPHTTTAPAPHPRTTPSPPVWPEQHAAPAQSRATQDENGVTVGHGESLWVIAARRLGPHASGEEIAAAWPRWYAANRDAIGADPSLLHPGQVLHAPTSIQSTQRNDELSQEADR